MGLPVHVHNSLSLCKLGTGLKHHIHVRLGGISVAMGSLLPTVLSSAWNRAGTQGLGDLMS